MNTTEPTQSGCGSCSCGSSESGGCSGGRVPELDARVIDPALRNAAVLGVLIGLVPGASAKIVMDDEPEVIHMLLQENLAGQFEISGGQDEDGAWRLKYLRLGAA